MKIVPNWGQYGSKHNKTSMGTYAVPSDLQMYNDGAWFQAYQKLAWGSMVPNRNVLGCIMMAFTMHRSRL